MTVARAIEGQCLCGAVTIRGLTAAPAILACHCRPCASAGRAASGLLLHRSDGRGPRDRGRGDAVAAYHASTWAERAFCGTCGTTLWTARMQGREMSPAYELMPGFFDDQRRPDRHGRDLSSIIGPRWPETPGRALRSAPRRRNGEAEGIPRGRRNDMTKYDAAWVAREEAKRAYMAEHGLWREEDEHSSCGVGLVVSIDGTRSRRVVEHGIDALKAVWHRGAVDADGKTGDGAGIHVQIPDAFFRDQIERTGHRQREGEKIAVGQVFLPRTDFGAQETGRTIVETEVLRMGHYIYGWRHVPVNVEVLGEKANATRPEIEQILISNAKGVDEETFERELYVIRRRIEKAAAAAQVNGLYFASLSCRSIIYKGMMLAEQVAEFYPDLKDERFESAFAIYHQRYSTNTFPQWWLAQPFRMLAHNGEINTLKGNVNWMKSHEIRMASATFGEMAEDIKPIIPQGASDSGALDAVFEVLVRAGRSAPMAKTMLVPESWSKQALELPEAWRDMYSYCNSVMEPWDGPAALAMTDGRWVCAGLDRNGLRPMRYVVTGDGLVIAGSEAGMVPVEEARVVEKGALGPGQILAVDMAEGRLYHDTEIKDRLAGSQPFGEWVGKINELDEALGRVSEKAMFSGAELRKRQIAAGYTIEELEQVLAPMVEDAKEAVASMGDDTPPAVLSEKYRPLSHFFRQNFSQVTNPPIDSACANTG
jgi:glutamate synthase (NADPH) large chain